MTGIFISYRQDDAKPWALLLRRELVEAFGEQNVFLDKDTLHAGNWRDQIQQALDQCKVFLVVMGRKWLTIADEHGKRRLDSPEDVHRQEIAFALSQKHVTVIPVRVDNAPVPHPAELPQDIRPLVDQQSRELSDMSARRDVDLKLLLADIERAAGLIARFPKNERDTIMESKSAQGKPTLGSLLLAAVISLVIIVFAEIGVRWSLDSLEKSFVVFVVLLMTLAGNWLRNHAKRRDHDET